MSALDSKQITELLEGEKKSTMADKPWVCPKCRKWTTSQAGAKYHKCSMT